MKIKNILLISPFFFPELISTGKFNTNLVTSLRDKGHKVTVLCFHPFYPDWQAEENNEQIHGVEIIRGGKNISFPKKTVLRRIVLELSFLFFVLRKIKKHQKGKDIILPIFPPSFAFYGILFFLKKNIQKVGMIHDLQELYATNKKGFVNKIISFFINKIEKKCYTSCDKLIFLSEEMKDQAIAFYGLKNIQLEVQYPFISITDKITNDLQTIFDLSKKHIVYSGALGEKQNPQKLYDFFNYAASKIENTCFHFFSQGLIVEDLKKQNKNLRIRFHNLVDKENIEELYSKSDVQIIPQLPNTSKGSLPSKLPNLLFSGCKILLITDSKSEIENLFNNSDLEKVINSWDFKIMLNALEELLKSKKDRSSQVRIAKKYFTIDRMIDKILN